MNETVIIYIFFTCHTSSFSSTESISLEVSGLLQHMLFLFIFHLFAICLLLIVLDMIQQNSPSNHQELFIICCIYIFLLFLLLEFGVCAFFS